MTMASSDERIAELEERITQLANQTTFRLLLLGLGVLLSVLLQFTV
jgi:hypothetical protein